MIVYFCWLVKFVSSVFEKLTNGSTEEPLNEMETSGIILVAGATGGVGRRVVDILRSRGLPVKALVLTFILVSLIFI